MDVVTVYFFAFVFAFLGQFLDAKTTDAFLTAKVAQEGNPIAKFIIKHFGIDGNYVFKCAILPGLSAATVARAGIHTGTIVALIIGAAGVLPGVYNYFKLRKSGIKIF